MTPLARVDHATTGKASERTDPLTPAVFHILLALSERPLHGYAVMQAVEDQSAMKAGPGTVYGSIRRMEAASLVEQLPVVEGRRKAFRLTAAGRKALADESARLTRLAALVADRKVLAGDG